MVRVRRSALCALSALMFALLAVVAKADDLVVNGSFETGDFSGWTLATSGSNVSIVTDFVPGPGPRTGTYAAQFQAFTTPDSLSQTLTNLIPGQDYLLTYYVTDILASDNVLFQVLFGTQSDAITSIPSDQWLGGQLLVTAPASGTLPLSFQAQDPQGAIYLDDVAVAAVPETSPAMLTAAGLVLLLGLAVRSRNESLTNEPSRM